MRAAASHFKRRPNGTARRTENGAMANISGPNVYPFGSVPRLSTARQWALFSGLNHGRSVDANGDCVSTSGPIAKARARGATTALLDTAIPLCYGLIVLGDSAPPDAGLIGWAKASCGCAGGEGNRRRPRGRIQFPAWLFNSAHDCGPMAGMTRVGNGMLVATKTRTLPLQTNEMARTFRKASKHGTPMFAPRFS